MCPLPLTLFPCGLGYPLGGNRLFPAPRVSPSSLLALPSPIVQPLSPAPSSPFPRAASSPTAATSWFEGANGQAPPGVSYLHHVGEGEGAGR